MKLRVLLFIVGRLLEYRRYLLISGLFRGGGEIGVLVARHRFSGKRLPKVFLRLASLKFQNDSSQIYNVTQILFYNHSDKKYGYPF